MAWCLTGNKPLPIPILTKLSDTIWQSYTMIEPALGLVFHIYIWTQYSFLSLYIYLIFRSHENMALMLITMIGSGHNLAHITTAELPLHVKNGDMIFIKNEMKAKWIVARFRLCAQEPIGDAPDVKYIVYQYCIQHEINLILSWYTKKIITYIHIYTYVLCWSNTWYDHDDNYVCSLLL